MLPNNGNIKLISQLAIEYFYPLIFVAINSGLLPLIVYLFSLYEKHYKRSYREKSILIKSFIFLLINTIFVPIGYKKEYYFIYQKMYLLIN